MTNTVFSSLASFKYYVGILFDTLNQGEKAKAFSFSFWSFSVSVLFSKYWVVN